MKQYVIKEQNNHTGVIVLFMAAAIFALRWWILAWLVLFLVGLGIRSLYRAYGRHKYAKAVWAETLRQRAEYENAAYYSGDPIGTYGAYSPATMPLTKVDPYLYGGHDQYGW